MAMIVLALAVVVMVFVVELGARAVRRAEAQTAADMAALAGVYEGRPGAVDLATRNGADLVAYRTDGVRVEVTVAVDGVRAVAAAVWDVTG